MRFANIALGLSLGLFASAAPNPGTHLGANNEFEYADAAAIPDNPLADGGKPTSTPSVAGARVKAVGSSSTSLYYTASPSQTNDPTHRGSWLPGYDINTDYDNHWPNTGKVVKYTLTIADNTTTSPDGTPPLPLMFINGQYPGPTLKANWGDTLQVTVINALKTNGTGIHFHGLRQLNNNLADGVSGMTECPIAPGDSAVYTFQATQYGTAWYHSHYSSQYGMGVLGPIVINGPASANYDIDMGTVSVTDWYNKTAFQEVHIIGHEGPQQAYNYLINGQNVHISGTKTTGARATFTVQPGKKHLFRLIGTGLDGMFKMTFDNHIMQVIAADFTPIVPYYTTELNLNIGQRYDVIVLANKTPGNYFFRAMAATDCSYIDNTGTGTANAVMVYSNSPNKTALPTSNYYANHTTTCVDEPQASLRPVIAKNLDSSTFVSLAKMDYLTLVDTPPGAVFQWTLGGNTQLLDWLNPSVIQTAAGNFNFNSGQNIQYLNQTNATYYWVIQNNFTIPHPMHLHGHDFYVLGEGNGQFNIGRDVGKLQFTAPPRRDTVNLIGSGWTVIGIVADNPGNWIFHCHIASHAGEGLSQQFMERPYDAQKLYKSGVQGSAFQTQCKNWANWYKTAPYPQDDSGL